MHHRRPTDRRSALRALAVLLALLTCSGTVLAAAGGARHDPAADVLQIARQQLGDPYQWGGTGPDAWDCSGLTSYLWRAVGGVDDIPRIASDQQAWAVPIPREQLLVGDLVFFGNPVTHVALYAGDGDVVDASSARGEVVQRPLWSSGVVRYGRVPRKDMPPVKPWTPPTVPVASPPPPPPPPAPAPAPALPAATARLVPLRGLPSPDLRAASTVAARAARNAKTVTGSAHWNDLALVRVAWHHAGGPLLPPTEAGLERASRPVPIGQARIGDVVVYGSPATHVGLYLGHGYMVDASPSLRRVVVRRVFVSPTIRVVRPSTR